jgi:hypothetical protein
MGGEPISVGLAQAAPPTRLYLLCVMRAAGRPLTAAELSRRSDTSPSNTSAIIKDCLLGDYVRRVGNGARLFALTPTGVDYVDAHFTAQHALEKLWRSADAKMMSLDPGEHP